MDKRPMKVWRDPEADFLEVILEHGIGVAGDTRDDRLEMRVDERGNILSFHIHGLKSGGDRPLETELEPRRKARSG